MKHDNIMMDTRTCGNMQPHLQKVMPHNCHSSDFHLHDLKKDTPYAPADETPESRSVTLLSYGHVDNGLTRTFLPAWLQYMIYEIASEYLTSAETGKIYLFIGMTATNALQDTIYYYQIEHDP